MYAILDIETTGGSARFEKITEIAIYIHDGNKIVREFSSLINPERPIPEFISRLTGITNEMVAGAPKFYEIAKEIVELTEGKTIVAHNAHFDYGFIREEFRTLGYQYHRGMLCTVKLARKLIPGHRSYSLGNLCNALGINNEARHRAAGDALATVKLFDLLIQNDHEGIITKDIRNNPSLMKLPPNLDKDEMDKLPEEAGVYYFHNENGDIIYIGKSINIRKRVLSHFSDKGSAKGGRMKNELCSITFETTGSELVALLLESDEIKKHKPRYNRALREAHFQYGIFKEVNDDGYFALKFSRIKTEGEEPLMTAKNADEAVEMLTRYCERYHLCQKLCGIYDIGHACLSYSSGQCRGACVGKEPPESYNKRVIQLIRKWRFENQNFFILAEGRNRKEQSIVAIENGRYIGFGYVDHDFTIENPEQLKFFIRNYSDNRDVQRILHRYLGNASSDKIINY